MKPPSPLVPPVIQTAPPQQIQVAWDLKQIAPGVMRFFVQQGTLAVQLDLPVDIADDMFEQCATRCATAKGRVRLASATLLGGNGRPA